MIIGDICPAGNYCGIGSTFPTHCLPGTYSNTTMNERVSTHCYSFHIVAIAIAITTTTITDVVISLIIIVIIIMFHL